MSEDPITWKEIGGAIVAGAVCVFSWITNKQVVRIDKLEDKSVSKDSFETHREEDHENFKQLFKGHNEITQKISDGFQDLNRTVTGIHTSLLQELNRKVDRK